jgi:aromatic-L-amino-acid decarboxylase
LRETCAAPLPHPDAATLHHQTDQALAWLVGQFAGVADLPIGRTGTRKEMEALLREPPPEIEQDFTKALAQYQEKVAPFACRIDHPRFLAFIPSAPTFYSVLGELLAAGTNPFAGVWLEAAGPAQVELVVLDWFKEFLGYPAEAAGVLTSGGSEANLTALVVAREHLAEEKRGRAVLYVSEQRHWSVDRAAKIIGLRKDQVRPVSCDGAWRMSPAVLTACVQEDLRHRRVAWAVVANGGATNTGVVDPLEDLAAVCQARKLWFHVDAAYGWAVALDPGEKHVLRGIERADSITLDAHKWFAQTFDVGCLLVREGTLLEKTFAMRPEYMQDVAPGQEEVNFADRGLALTRRFRALKLWLSIKVLGVSWFRRLVNHSCRLAEFAEVILRRSPDFKILSPRRLSVVCFRFAPSSSALQGSELDSLNLGVVDEVRKTGRAFLSSTRLNGCVALRLCFVNWRTTAADVEEVLNLVSEVGARLLMDK